MGISGKIFSFFLLPPSSNEPEGSADEQFDGISNSVWEVGDYENAASRVSCFAYVTLWQLAKFRTILYSTSAQNYGFFRVKLGKFIVHTFVQYPYCDRRK